MSKFFKAAALPLALALSYAPAANAFPEKNIKFLIPYGPGGGFDVTVRKLAPLMEKILADQGKKIQVIPTNMPGGSGRKAASYLFKAKPDGHTFMIFNMPGHGLGVITGKKVGYDFEKFTILGRVGHGTYVVVTAKNSPLKSIKDIVALKRPIKVPDQGPGSTARMASLIVWETLGVKAEHIGGYKSSNDYATAVLRGDGDLTLLAAGSAARYNARGDYNIIAHFAPKPAFEGAVNGKMLGKPDLEKVTLDRIVAGPPKMSAEVTKAVSDLLLKAATDKSYLDWADKTGNPADPLDAAGAKKEVDAGFAYFAKFKDVIANSK
ncbi:MAG: tripartite tricarboxylate transporter substrate-binding protein [Beijerinckiaceae bacterium]|nr:tripartite tricarboxylate transporter substrate-binding protein [Beijerinckiaceae bacterium]